MTFIASDVISFATFKKNVANLMIQKFNMMLRPEIEHTRSFIESYTKSLTISPKQYIRH